MTGPIKQVLRSVLRTWNVSSSRGKAISFLLLTLVNGISSAEPYRLAVVPQYDAVQINAIWKPIIDDLVRQTGLGIVLDGAASISEFEDRLLAREWDIVFVNPLQMAKVADFYAPLVADSSQNLYGIVVVKKESGITSVQQLDGQTVAFPSPHSLAASILVQSELTNIHRVKVNPIYVKSHDSAYLNVLSGLTLAGGGVQKTLSKQADFIRNGLRVIYKTREVKPHPIAVRKSMHKNDRKKLLDALLTLAGTPTGKQLLNQIPIQSLGPAFPSDYKTLLNIAPVNKVE